MVDFSGQLAALTLLVMVVLLLSGLDTTLSPHDPDDHCYCDWDRCSRFLDCCRDCPDNSSADDLETRTSSWNSDPDTGGSLLPISRCSSNNRATFYIVDRCPDQSLCSRTEQHLHFRVPVTDQSLIFLNRNCALCHNTSISDIQELQTELVCEQDRDSGGGECYLVPVVPEHLTRECYSSVVTSCPSNYNDDHIKFDCESVDSYAKIFTDGDSVFRNNACCSCNHGSEYCVKVRSRPRLPVVGQVLAQYNISRGLVQPVSNHNHHLQGSSTTSSSISTESLVSSPSPVIVSNSSSSNITGGISKNKKDGENGARSIDKISNSDRLTRDLSSILSIVMMFFCIVIYVSHDRLFGSVGKLAVALCTCLILVSLSQLIVRILKAPSTVCRISAVVLHLFLLTKSGTGLVMMLGMLKHCRLLERSRVAYKRDRFGIKIMLAAGLGTPLFIIIFSITADRVHIKKWFTAGYGEQSCWIDHYTGAILWLLLPSLMAALGSASILGFVYRLRRRVLLRAAEFEPMILIAIEHYFHVGIRYIVMLGVVVPVTFIKMRYEDSGLVLPLRLVIRLEGVWVALILLLAPHVRVSLTAGHHPGRNDSLNKASGTPSDRMHERIMQRHNQEVST